MAKQVYDGDLATTLIKFRCDGLTLEQWEEWRKDPIAIGTAVNDKLSRENLEDDEGHKVVHMRM